MDELRKEFEEKFIHQGYGFTFQEGWESELWFWIQQKLIEAKIEENEWWIKRYEQKNSIQDDLEAIHFHECRIKELKGRKVR